MPVLSVDSHRRVYIPKEMGLEAEKVIALRHADSLILVPVPNKIIEIDTELPVKALKKTAEEKARGDATRRRAG